jgi:hypothetical protein
VVSSKDAIGELFRPSRSDSNWLIEIKGKEMVMAWFGCQVKGVVLHDPGVSYSASAYLVE